MQLDLINEDKLGVAKGTELEEELNKGIHGETIEVALYLAMARQAQRQGYPEIAEVLEVVAWEEALHAARYVELNGRISENTKENLAKMVDGEQGSNKGKKEAARKAKELSLDPVHDFLDEASRDEARHARALAGLLERHFGGA